MTTTVEVKCDDSTHLYWRKVGNATWAQLTPTMAGAPSIKVVSSGVETFEFVQHSGSAHTILYKDDPGSTPQQLPTSNGPTVNVASDTSNYVFFAKNETGGTYYTGSVTVSSDDF